VTEVACKLENLFIPVAIGSSKNNFSLGLEVLVVWIEVVNLESL
jgi:hypothetical protein